MKRSIMVLMFLVVVSIAASGCGSKTTVSPGEGKGAAVAVAVETVNRGDVVRELVVSGQLVGEQSVVVSPKISGKVAAINVELGSRVDAGSTLFTLDDTDIRAQVQQSVAAVAVQAAKKKAAEQNRESVARQYERNKQLFDQGVVSADALDQIKLKLDQALSEEPEANLAQMEASLAYQQNQLANSVVSAPISGEVAARTIETGSMVSSTTQAITLVNLDRVKVQVSVGDQQIGKLKQGQAVKVVIASIRPEPFIGVIANLSPAADAKTKSFLVEVKMDNPDHVLKQGMFAEVHIVTDRSEKVLAVPVDAVVARGGENFVFSVVDGAAKENKVKTGISDGKVTEILEGLAEGDRVIVLGQQGLINGSKVMVQGSQGGQPNQTGKQGQGSQP